MDNELRYYLQLIEKDIQEETFKPTYIVTAVRLPTGAIELATNTSNIPDKLNYILEAYDDNMCLLTNPEIQMTNIMIV
jgi:hypothetical protein